MNALVIDDQRQVVDSICAGLKWEELGVQHVYGAYSAKEAKQIIQTFKIDILLSDIDGLYSDDPHDNPDAKLIREVDTLDRKILGMAKSSTGSDVGTGGMATKLTAAKIATYSGADMIIANGGNMGILYDIMNDRYTGTLFHRAKDAEFVLADYIQREMAPTSTGGQ